LVDPRVKHFGALCNPTVRSLSLSNQNLTHHVFSNLEIEILPYNYSTLLLARNLSCCFVYSYRSLFAFTNRPLSRSMFHARPRGRHIMCYMCPDDELIHTQPHPLGEFPPSVGTKTTIAGIALGWLLLHELTGMWGKVPKAVNYIANERNH